MRASIWRGERTGDGAFITEAIDIIDAAGDDRGGDDEDGDRDLPGALLGHVRDMARGVMSQRRGAFLLGHAHVVRHEV